MICFKSAVILSVCVFHFVNSTSNFIPENEGSPMKFHLSLPDPLHHNEGRKFFANERVNGKIRGYHRTVNNMRYPPGFLKPIRNKSYQDVDMNDARRIQDTDNDVYVPTRDIEGIEVVTSDPTVTAGYKEEVNDMLKQNDKNSDAKDKTQEFNSDIGGVAVEEGNQGSSVDVGEELTATEDETTTVVAKFEDSVLDYEDKNEENSWDSGAADDTKRAENIPLNFGEGLISEFDMKKIKDEAKLIDTRDSFDRRRNEYAFYDVPTSVNSDIRVKRDDGTIFFEDENSNVVDPFDEQIYSDAEKRCFEQEKVLFDGSCQTLYDQGLCKNGEWLVIQKPASKDDRQPLKPVCKPKPCKAKEDWWSEQKKCVVRSVAKRSYCGVNQEVAKDPYGDALCSCTEDYGSLESSNDCHAYYSQGPCPTGQVVTYNAASGYAVCTRDRCLKQNNMRRNQNRSRNKRASYQHVKHYADSQHHVNDAFNRRRRNIDNTLNRNNADDEQIIINRRKRDTKNVLNKRFKRNLIDASDFVKCKSDDNNNCRENVMGSWLSPEKYLLDMKRQLKTKRNKDDVEMRESSLNIDKVSINRRKRSIDTNGKHKNNKRKMLSSFVKKWHSNDEKFKQYDTVDEMKIKYRRKRQIDQRYAPLNGDGQCFKLESSEGCEGPDWRFTVDRRTHVPRCRNAASLALNLADAIDKCKVDERNECRENIMVSRPTPGQYLQAMKHQLKRKRST